MDPELQRRIDILSREVTRLRLELLQSRRIEASLRKGETQYRNIFCDAAIGLAVIDPDGRFIDVNPACCALLGYTREELLSMTHLDVSHPDERLAQFALRNSLLSGQAAEATVEKRYIKKSGEIVWANLHLSVSPRQGRRPQYLLAAIEDVNERQMLQDFLGRIATNLAQREANPLTGTWKWDIVTNETRADPEIFQIFGMEPSDHPVPLETFLDRIVPEDRDNVMKTLQAAMTEHAPKDVEYSLIGKKGQRRIVAASGAIYQRDEQGAPRLMLGIVQDITDKRRSEAALQDSELRLRQLFDHAVDAIFIATTDGQYTEVNLSACAMLGYSRDELIGKHIVDLIPERDRDRLLRSKDHFTADPSHTQIEEWELRKKDGTYLPVEISTRILPDGRWLAFVRDISERRRTRMALERYAAEIEDLYDNAPCGYHSLDRDGCFVRINKTELDWLGYTREEMIGKHISVLLTDEGRRTFEANYPNMLRTGMVHELEFEFRRKDGSLMPVMVSASAVYDEHGKYSSSRTTVFDMRGLLEARKRLRRAATVFEHTNEAIVITDADSAIVAVNNAFTKITGFTPQEVIGKTPRILKSEWQDDAFYRSLWESIDSTGSWQGEIWDKRKSGEVFPAWESITAVRDDTGKITDYISIFSDITTIKETEQQLLKLAYHDPLTGLANRLLFTDRLGQALAHAKRHHCRAALLLLDLDRFKLINDTLGHAIGDELLKTIAARLNDAIRHEDTVARLGGDEFAVILAQMTTIDEAALLAEKIVHLVCQPVNVLNHSLMVSGSVGIAICPDDAQDGDALAKCADIAMYGAKEKGKNTYEFYTDDMTRVATERLLIDHALRNAIRLDELMLHYQPKVELSTGRITGVEGLIRWNCHERGMQQPDRFISIAEETDLIESIGSWVFETACRQLRQWAQAGVPPVRVAINLSARQIKRAGFIDDIRHAVQSCVPHGGYGLDVEVTESTLQTDAEIIDGLKELRALGLHIAIDDFGTGYSSLNSLKRLPIDVLKIDRSFVQGIPDDADDKAIASAIVAMGHSLKMRIVAEGIETMEQFNFMKTLQCDEAQGFLFFKPLTADECGEWLMRGMRQGIPGAAGSISQHA